MSANTPKTMIGCLLDVSGSMKQALESGESDERAVERLQAVLRAALKLAEAEQRSEPDAHMFVGAFGLNGKDGGAQIIDLCSTVESFLSDDNSSRSGHELLIELANEHRLEHITNYIRTKLTEDEARILSIYLRKHPERVPEFIDAIPSRENVKNVQVAKNASRVVDEVLIEGIKLLFPPLGTALLSGTSDKDGFSGPLTRRINAVEDRSVENSKALLLARRMVADWLRESAEFTPRPVSKIVELLRELQVRPGKARNSMREEDETSVLDTLRQYMYGSTPMRHSISQAMVALGDSFSTQRRILVIVSDGESTDGNPLPLAQKWQRRTPNITIATVFLTNYKNIPRRQLYDQEIQGWTQGQKILFRLASKVATDKHPIPVLASSGWKIPSSGECALYTTVCSVTALEEFCSILLSARFSSADALLDLVGRFNVDAYINDEHMRTRNNPSDQLDEGSCYAHATAAVAHMALTRIIGRQGGCPSIQDIRARILNEFPPTVGYATEDVLKQVIKWYRPLKYREVDEDGARQAVLRRRPVLATFRLSESGWDEFSDHFGHAHTRKTILTTAQMVPLQSRDVDGGHAVVLTSCAPGSLTFLNSWGSDWGNNGSFSIEDHKTLELDSASGYGPMRFFDVFWFESDLEESEREAFKDQLDEKIRLRANEHPSILELEAQCPLPGCKVNSPIAHYTGSIRKAKCPKCGGNFVPEPGNLVKALYAQAGLDEVPTM